MKNLESSLRRLKKTYLNTEIKDRIKNHVFSQINLPKEERLPRSLFSIVKFIKNAVSSVQIGQTQRVLIKERVFAAIERKTMKTFFWVRFLSFSKKAVSFALLLFMGFTFFSFMTLDTRVVRAETFTTLDAYFGDVKISRNGEVIEIYKGMEIFENDRIFTGGDGWAQITYFDDSVTRLAADTEMTVNRLDKEKENFVDSYVEVSIMGGDVWSRVVNLVGDSSSFVVKAKKISAKAKRAAFNVSVRDDIAEIGVFNNSVDLEMDETGDREKIVSGQKAVFDSDAVMQVKEIDDNEQNGAWVKENKENDKEYILAVEERLIAAKKESVDEDDGLGENVKLFLTFSDVKKQKVELDLAEKDFISAELKLHEEDLSEEEKLETEKELIASAEKFKKFNEFVKQVEVTDSQYAEDLESYYEEKVLSFKKDLSLKPEAKKVVDDLEALSAKDEFELIEVKVDQAIDKLAEIEDRSESEDKEKSEDLIADYGENVEDVIEILDTMDEEKKKEINEKLSENIEVMTVISDKKVADENVKGLVEKAKEKLSNQDYEIIGETIEESSNDGDKIITPKVQEKEDPFGVKIEGDKPLPPIL